MRSNQSTVSLNVGGVDRGIWAVREGGGVSADNTTYAPGGMQPRIALGGSPTVDDVTLRKLYDDVAHADVPDLMNRIGDTVNGASVVTNIRNTGPGRAASGRALVYRGILTAVNVPDFDADSDDAAELEVVIGVGAPPTLA